MNKKVSIIVSWTSGLENCIKLFNFDAIEEYFWNFTKEGHNYREAGGIVHKQEVSSS